ncbi:MAG TPA: cytochrome P450, partial [Burkholderiaceae bacterium]|nr:cytochrome P450 [Burkholderiaceae bacterium]
GHLPAGPELLAPYEMLLFAGHETTRHFLGNALHALLTTPSAWQELLAHPERLPAAVRELLRYDSPVQYTGRRVKTDLLLHGQRIKRGDLVIALIGSANRDERVYETPDTLNFARPAKPPLSFGSGAHVCIGAALTLMEAELVFEAMLKRWPRLQLTPHGAQRNSNPLYRGLLKLRINT